MDRTFVNIDWGTVMIIRMRSLVNIGTVMIVRVRSLVNFSVWSTEIIVGGSVTLGVAIRRSMLLVAMRWSMFVNIVRKRVGWRTRNMSCVVALWS